MAENISDYEILLADMEAKKNLIEQAIISVKAALAAGALGKPGETSTSSVGAGSLSAGGSIDLPIGAFLNKSVPAAIKLYLSAVKKKQTISQITAALRDGGVESTAANFETVVTGALHRLKTAGEVLRFKDGWGLADHYPEHIRKAISQERKSARKKTKKIAKPKAKKESGEKAQIVQITKGLEQRIETILMSNNGKPLDGIEVAEILKVNPTGVVLSLGRMRKKGKVEKIGSGYRLCTETQKAI